MTALRAASIRELCGADHCDDPAAIARWIGGPDKFADLLEQGDAVLVVAELDGAMAGLGGFRGDLVTLNYVHPAYGRRGVSTAIMRVIESRMLASGIAVGRLNSTATALGFYRGIGWTEAGMGTADDGYPMTKRLAP